MAPNISSRAFIQWLPAPRSEPTTTLVLTSSACRYIDIRILKVPKPGETHSVDWAFAGTSSSQTENGKHISRWKHWIDSTTLSPETLSDQGEMLPPDSSGLVLEKGSMINPETGELTEYVEGWEDVDTSAISADGKKSSVVLQHEDTANQARGVVIKLGQYMQGLIRVGEVFSVERWQWEQTSGWKLAVRVGDLPLPCRTLLETCDTLEEDQLVESGDRVWKCVEVEEF